MRTLSFASFTLGRSVTLGCAFNFRWICLSTMVTALAEDFPPPVGTGFIKVKGGLSTGLGNRSPHLQQKFARSKSSYRLKESDWNRFQIDCLNSIHLFSTPYTKARYFFFLCFLSSEVEVTSNQVEGICRDLIPTHSCRYTLENFIQRRFIVVRRQAFLSL